MIPSVTPPIIATKPASLDALQSANRTFAPPPDAMRSSTGEASAANLRSETTKAIDAPTQSAVTPRLRDQEMAEHSDRLLQGADDPTGPPPAFDESPLKRQARVALKPPAIEIAIDPENDLSGNVDNIALAGEPDEDTEDPVPPPTPRERAEVSFSETRSIAQPPEPPSLDVSA
ncbi:MAG: hypothetical protein RLO38_09170 [Roseovarius confluentis]